MEWFAKFKKTKSGNPGPKSGAFRPKNDEKQPKKGEKQSENNEIWSGNPLFVFIKFSPKTKIHMKIHRNPVPSYQRKRKKMIYFSEF